MSKTNLILTVATLLALLVLGLTFIDALQRQAACHDHGGVMVREAVGTTCVRLEVIG